MSSDDGGKQTGRRAVANNSPSDTDEVVWRIGTLHDLGIAMVESLQFGWR